MRDILGWEDPSLKVFAIDEVLTKSCGWVWWHEDVLVISDRPKEIHRDAANLLHSITGPAISYRDGWSLYYVHGVAVPADWIELKAKLDPRMALTWENIEQRRALAEIIGWDRVLQQTEAKEIQRDEFGILLEVNLPQAAGAKFVRVRCGTGRDFVLPVPQDIKSAHAAVAWTYGVNVLEYAPEVRT
jgi:hypothetical protein